MRWREPWTNHEDAALARARADGLGYREIAARLGRTVEACAARLRRVGLVDSVRYWSPLELRQAVRLRRLGRRWHEVREALVLRGHPRRDLSQLVAKVRAALRADEPAAQLVTRPWTGAETRLAVRLWQGGGCTWADLAHALHRAGDPRRTRTGVRKRVCKFLKLAKAENNCSET